MNKPQTHCADLTYLPEAIHTFTEYPRWTCWRWELVNGRWTKPPRQPNGQFAKTNDPSTWCTFPEALAVMQTGKCDGIGFMLAGTQIAAIDLDKCRDPDTGALDSWAANIVADAREEGAYIEITVSGTGVRILGISAGSRTLRSYTVNGHGGKAEFFLDAEKYVTTSGLEIGCCSELPELPLFDRLLAKFESQKTNSAGNGASATFDFNNAPEQHADIDDIIKNGVPRGQRSEAFQRVVSHLAEQGLGVDEIEAVLKKHPAGIANKFWTRLRQEIERSFTKWQEKQGKSPQQETENAPFISRVKRGGDFIAEYEPIVYTIDGMLPSGCIYGVTGRRGTGKTAFLQGTALSTVSGSKDVLGLEVEPGRVGYIILENPTDFRMKLAVGAYVHRVEIDSLNERLAVLDAHLPHSEIMAQLKYDAQHNGPFRLVCYDTYQAGFSGAALNANEDMLRHAQSLRQLTTLPGNPAVLVACHPVKNATKDNLEPYGGGSTMNEFDGNLTLWDETGRIELGWNKVRGPEFDIRYFYIDKLGSPDILDSKGRTPLLPVMRPMSATDAERCQEVNCDLNRLSMIDNPDGSQTDWGIAIGRAKSNVNNRLQELKQLKLVKPILGKWRVTPEGRKGAANTED